MKAKSLGPYSDIVPILDTALAQGGARFQLATPQAVTRWIQRANMARKIDRELRAEVRKPGDPIESKWERLRIAKDGDFVSITIREAITEIITPSGERVKVQPTTPVEAIDDLLDFARKLGS